MINKYKKRNKFGEIQRKILLLLMGGIALSCTRSLNKQFEIIGDIVDEWEGTKKFHAKKSLHNLWRKGFIKERIKPDGTIEIVLSETGKIKAEFFSLDNLKIKKPKRWDGNWRIVIFDIPEKLKIVRESVRMHLKNLEFYELQKSVFIFPFPCLEEIDSIVKFYNIKDHVRLITANSLDNEQDLMAIFRL